MEQYSTSSHCLSPRLEHIYDQGYLANSAISYQHNFLPTAFSLAIATETTKLPDLAKILQNAKYLQTISFSFHRFMMSLEKMRKIVSFSESIIKHLSSANAVNSRQNAPAPLYHSKLVD